MNNLESIVYFANNSFQDGDVIAQSKNLKSLIKFMKRNEIDTNSFEIEDYIYLMDHSSKLSNMVSAILKLKDYNTYMGNDLFSSLAIVYAGNNDVKLKDFDENAEISDKDLDSTGTYMQEIGSFKVLTQKEETDLFNRLAKGDESVREIIINHNLKLVVSIAKRYQANAGLPLLDLIQEGNIGLMKAIERFDVTKGYKFSTYATWWIRQAVVRSIANDSRVIRIPVHAHDLILKISKYQTNFFLYNGYYASAEELAVVFNEPVEKINEILRTQDVISLSTPVKGDNGMADSELGEFLVDTSFPANLAEKHLNLEMLHNLVFNNTKLTDREKYVIDERFGLTTRVGKNLEEVGKELNLTRERIRQIEHKALKKLSRVPGMKEFSPGDFEEDVCDSPYIFTK